ncbi:MAG TPA: hypothetical protein VIM38_04650 [Alphaproteobacteria bacterium]
MDFGTAALVFRDPLAITRLDPSVGRRGTLANCRHRRRCCVVRGAHLAQAGGGRRRSWAHHQRAQSDAARKGGV